MSISEYLYLMFLCSFHRIYSWKYSIFSIIYSTHLDSKTQRLTPLATPCKRMVNNRVVCYYCTPILECSRAEGINVRTTWTLDSVHDSLDLGNIYFYLLIHRYWLQNGITKFDGKRVESILSTLSHHTPMIE